MLCNTCEKLMNIKKDKFCLKCKEPICFSLYIICELCADKKCQHCLKTTVKVNQSMGCFSCTQKEKK